MSNIAEVRELWRLWRESLDEGLVATGTVTEGQLIPAVLDVLPQLLRIEAAARALVLDYPEGSGWVCGTCGGDSSHHADCLFLALKEALEVPA